jgi:hypothetical protein
MLREDIPVAFGVLRRPYLGATRSVNAPIDGPAADGKSPWASQTASSHGAHPRRGGFASVRWAHPPIAVSAELGQSQASRVRRIWWLARSSALQKG